MKGYNLKTKKMLVVTSVLMLCIFIMSVVWGDVPIPLYTLYKILTGQSGEQEAIYKFIILDNRLPQSITAVLCGIALSVAGYMLQNVYRNLLASPSLLGVDAGAALGVAIIMLSVMPQVAFINVPYMLAPLNLLASFTGASAILMLILWVSKKLSSNIHLLIIGILVSYLASSFISLLNFFAGAENVQAYAVWGMGSFSRTTWSDLPIFFVLVCVGIVGALQLVKSLNVWQLGNSYATTLGLPVKKTRTQMLFTAGLLTATSVAFCGPIGFIGLAVPHIVRFALRTEDSRWCLPYIIIIGATMALCCLIVTSFAINGIMLPINVITPWVGAPVIIAVIGRYKNSQF